jgi:hypothetical protein
VGVDDLDTRSRRAGRRRSGLFDDGVAPERAHVASDAGALVARMVAAIRMNNEALRSAWAGVIKQRKEG